MNYVAHCYCMGLDCDDTLILLFKNYRQNFYKDVAVYTFGGNVFLCLGDFRQILSVVEHGSRFQILNASFKWSVLFPLLKTFSLKQYMRLQALHHDENADEDELQFPFYLHNIGEGKLQVDRKKSIQLPLSVKKTFTYIYREWSKELFQKCFLTTITKIEWINVKSLKLKISSSLKSIARLEAWFLECNTFSWA